MGRILWLVAGAAVAASAYAAGPAARTAITVFAAPPDAASNAQGEFGGATYGEPIAPPTGALVTERRDLDVGAGEVRLTGVPDTIDPASVQLRGVTEPIVVGEQRFVPGATTIEEVMARHIGEPITVTTPKGDVTGTLRAVDPLAIVVETGGTLRVLRRDGYVLDVKLPGGSEAAQPELVWKLSGAHGKQPVEITYRADGLSWSADYTAVFDPAAKTLDFTAWATVKNTTTASFDDAELTLVDTPPGPAVSSPSKGPAPVVRGPSAAPMRFVVPGLVKLGAGETVQVALAPPRTGVKVRPVVTFEAMPDPSANFQQFQAVDCNQLSAQTTGGADLALELDTPGRLPEGKVRLFERAGSRLDVISESQLHASPNVARIRIAADGDVVGERHATSCNYDEHARTIREKVELSIENHGKQRVTVIAREFMWRWPMWHLEGDELPKGTRAGPQTEEYRFDLAPGGKQLVSYTVVYAW